MGGAGLKKWAGLQSRRGLSAPNGRGLAVGVASRWPRPFPSSPILRSCRRGECGGRGLGGEGGGAYVRPADSAPFCS